MGNGYAGVDAVCNTGSVGLPKSTLPAGPNTSGVLFGSTVVVMVRPWLAPQTPVMPVKSPRVGAIAKPARSTDPWPARPISQPSGPPAWGRTHAVATVGAQ